MAIGIIGALDEEIEEYKNLVKEIKEEEIAGIKFYLGKIEDIEVVIAKCGVGKVNAALCTQIMIDRKLVDKIIFTGVAGAINPILEIGDIVISTDSVQHDMDGEKLGFEKGQIPYTDLKFFKASESLIELAKKSCDDLKLKNITGRILTGDQFITNALHSEQIKTLFLGDCVDMESAAVAHVCVKNKIEHLIIRAISDKADHKAEVNFKEFVKSSAKNSSQVVLGILKSLKTEDKTKKRAEFIKSKIRTIAHWPKQGVMFRDITTLLNNAEGFSHVIDILEERYKKVEIDKIVGIESRGFIIASALASRLKKPLVLIRKPGKLPAETIREEYELEYGKDAIEIHKDAITPGQKVIIADDLCATGGTMLASARLIEKLGAEVLECAFIIDLPELEGSRRISKKYKVFKIIDFEGE